MNPVRIVFAWACCWLRKRSTSGDPVGKAPPAKGIVIEFYGGPLDGHRETIGRKALRAMPDRIETPVSLAQFDMLEGIELRSNGAPASIAIYDLVRLGRQCRFQFRRQIPARQTREQARN